MGCIIILISQKRGIEDSKSLSYVNKQDLRAKKQEDTYQYYQVESVS